MRLALTPIMFAVLLVAAVAQAQPTPAWIVDAGAVEPAEEVTPLTSDAPTALALPPPAAGEPENAEEALGVAARTIRAFRSREWLAAFGGLIMLLVFAARLVLARWTQWVEAKRWRGLALAVAVAALVELGTAFLAGQPFSPGMLGAALGAALAAAGVWHARPGRG